MSTGYESVLIFLAVTVAFVVVVFGFASLVRPHRPSAEKLSTYECGERPLMDAWFSFDVHYYIVGLLFLIFDVEAVFLVPWGLVVQKLGLFGVVEGMVFLSILGVGLAYAWKKGALEWVS